VGEILPDDPLVVLTLHLRSHCNSPMLSLIQVRKKLRGLASPAKQRILTSFFKCGVGQYGEGDRFIGVTVPQVRSLLPRTSCLSFSDIAALIQSPIHEERLLALLILVKRFGKSDEAEQKKIFDFYIRFKKFVNNWDLVDQSTAPIVGAYLKNKSRRLLFKLAEASSLWDRRIAVVATWHFIRNCDLKTTFDLCEKLLNDEEDLMHKACGWMLREAGKRDVKSLERFLNKNAKYMPRTMLRYAIEKFHPNIRRKYLGIRKVNSIKKA